MALDQGALSELLDALRAGGDLDVVREGLALVLQALIEAEATQQIGAGRYERTASRTTHRNGSRGRLLSTKAGDVELRIPKLGCRLHGEARLAAPTRARQRHQPLTGQELLDLDQLRARPTKLVNWTGRLLGSTSSERNGGNQSGRSR